MSWYTKYLLYFERPFDSVPKTAIEEVRPSKNRFGLFYAKISIQRRRIQFGRFIQTKKSARIKFYRISNLTEIKVVNYSQSFYMQ